MSAPTKPAKIWIEPSAPFISQPHRPGLVAYVREDIVKGLVDVLKASLIAECCCPSCDEPVKEGKESG